MEQTSDPARDPRRRGSRGGHSCKPLREALGVWAGEGRARTRVPQSDHIASSR